MSTSDTKPFLPAYHYTDTIRLPWIIESGELRPGTNRIGGYPQDFLWATTSESGDRTSSAMSPLCKKLYREGILWRVRLTLNAADFTSFSDIGKSCPEWTSGHTAQLIKSAAYMGERHPCKWLCRSEPLSLAKIIRAEAKSYAGGQWIEIDLSLGRCIAARTHPHTRGIVIGEHAYMARRELLTDGNVAYDDVIRLPIASAADPIRAEPERRHALERVRNTFTKVNP
ncbi:hypothetical protein ACFIOY_00270 [Bradyrhizobium sp. TZ2]